MSHWPSVWNGFDGVVSRLGADHPAFLKGDDVVTFAELHARALAARDRLLKLGCAPGDRCVIWSENSVEMAAAILGALAGGMIPTLVNARSPVTHAVHAVRQTGAAAMLTSEDRLDTPAECLVLSLVSPAVTGRLDRRSHDAAAMLGQVASIVFTSGSTGMPKGVAQSQMNLMWGAHAVGQAMAMSERDRMLSAVPWAFDYGWGHLLSTILLGVTQILPERPGPLGLCEAIERHRPTILPGIPTLMAELLGGMAPIRDIDRSSIRLITNTGSKIPGPTFAQMLEVFVGADISLNYGLTETYRSATLPPPLARVKPTSVGSALAGAALAVLREDGSLADPGERGEVIHRGAGVFLGYWGDPERTARARRPDPLAHDALIAPPAVYTGDIGWKDDEGHLYLEGRRDRQLKSMGIRISPDEIEGVLLGSGHVREVAIVGLPHDIVGHQIAAVVSLPDGAVPEAQALRPLKIHARDNLAPYMRPMLWHVVDRLPRNPNGKVDYKVVTDLAAGLRAPAG